MSSGKYFGPFKWA